MGGFIRVVNLCDELVCHRTHFRSKRHFTQNRRQNPLVAKIPVSDPTTLAVVEKSACQLCPAFKVNCPKMVSQLSRHNHLYLSLTGLTLTQIIGFYSLVFATEVEPSHWYGRSYQAKDPQALRGKGHCYESLSQ